MIEAKLPPTPVGLHLRISDYTRIEYQIASWPIRWAALSATGIIQAQAGTICADGYSHTAPADSSSASISHSFMVVCPKNYWSNTIW